MATNLLYTHVRSGFVNGLFRMSFLASQNLLRHTAAQSENYNNYMMFRGHKNLYNKKEFRRTIRRFATILQLI